MTAVAWVLWFLLAAIVVGYSVGWIRREHEVIAPFPIFLGTVALYVLPRAAYLLWFGRAPLTSGGLPWDRVAGLLARILLAAIVSAVAFLVGHARPSAARAGGRSRLALLDPDPKRVLWVGGVALFVGGVVLAYMLYSLGDLSYALSHQYEIGTILEGKQSIFQLTRVLTVAVILLLVNPTSRKSRWWVWVMAVVTAICLLPFGYRAYILLAIASPVALYHLTVRRIGLRWMLSIGVPAAAVTFSMAYVRLLGATRIEEAARAFAQRPLRAVHFAFNASGELKILDAMSIVVRDVPDVLPYNYGATFWRVPWMAVPRRLWKDKPRTSGHIIVDKYLPQLRTGYPPMAIGEFYWAAGWLGVVVGFLGLGWISRAGWEWHERNRGIANASLYLLFCFFVFDFSRVGDPGRAIWFLVVGAAMTVLTFGAAARTSMPAPSQSTRTSNS